MVKTNLYGQPYNYYISFIFHLSTYFYYFCKFRIVNFFLHLIRIMKESLKQIYLLIFFEDYFEDKEVLISQ